MRAKEVVKMEQVAKANQQAKLAIDLAKSKSDEVFSSQGERIVEQNDPIDVDALDVEGTTTEKKKVEEERVEKEKVEKGAKEKEEEKRKAEKEKKEE